MTYDPRTNKINYAPVEEMESLRTKSLGSLGPETTATALPASSVRIALLCGFFGAPFTIAFFAMFGLRPPSVSCKNPGTLLHVGMTPCSTPKARRIVHGANRAGRMADRRSDHVVWRHVSPARVFSAVPCMHVQACDIEVQFKRPTANTTVSVHTTGGTFFMDYTAGDTVQVGFAATPSNLAANLETSAGSGKGTGPRPGTRVDTVTMLASDTVISFRIFLDTNVGEVR